MAYNKNKEQLKLIDLEKHRDYEMPITLDVIIEQFCFQHKISPRKLMNFFNFFSLDNKIYMVSKKAGVDIELLESKEHEEILNILSNLENKTTHHYRCDFCFADSMYDVHFFHFVKHRDRNINMYDKPINTSIDFENTWGNVIRTIEDLRT